MKAQKRGYVFDIEGVYSLSRITYNVKDPTTVQLLRGKDQRETYRPQDLQSFGYKGFLGVQDSITYVSAVLPGDSTSSVFMRQHIEGNFEFLELEHPTSRFFYRNSGRVLEITKENYKSILKELAKGKPFWTLESHKVRFRRLPLIQFFQALNTKGKTQINLSKYQLFVASTSGEATLNTAFNGVNTSANQSTFEDLSFGISLYSPFKKSLHFGINTQFSLEQFSMVGKSRSVARNQDILIQLDRILFEVAPTYKMVLGRFNAYIFVGGQLGKVIKSKDRFLTANITGNQINLRDVEYSGTTKTPHLGLTGGVGINFHLTPLVLSGLEFRWGSSSFNDMSINELSYYRISLKLGL